MHDYVLLVKVGRTVQAQNWVVISVPMDRIGWDTMVDKRSAAMIWRGSGESLRDGTVVGCAE